MQCGGRIRASATIKLYLCVMHWNAIIVAPHVNYALDPPHACIQPTRAPCDLTFVVCHSAVQNSG